MKRRIALLLLASLFAAVCAVGRAAFASADPRAITLHASDGVAVAAYTYAPPHRGAPIVLLFHQASSNHAEYATIAPRLVGLGFGAIAIDQRSGGDFYPGGNATVRTRGQNDEAFTDALPDLEATLAYSRRTYPGAPIYVWGSSYSAALVFELVAKHPHEVAALLAFSPGEYFDDPTYVRTAAKRVDIPVFVDSAANAEEEARAKTIVDAVASTRKTQDVPHHGIHGSSTLNTDRDPEGAAENWNAVIAFLTSLRRR